MEQELEQATRTVALSDAICAAELYGYDTALCSLMSNMQMLPGLENLTDASEELRAELRGNALLQFGMEAERVQNAFDTKFDNALDDTEKELNDVKEQVAKGNFRKPSEKEGDKIPAILLGTVTGALDALSRVRAIVDRATQAASHGIGDEIDRNFRRGQAAFIKASNAKIYGHSLDLDIDGAKSIIQRTMDKFKQNPELVNTEEGQSFIKSAKNMSEGVTGARASIDNRIRQSMKTLNEAEAAIKHLRETRREMTGMAAKLAMPVYKKIGLIALMVAIHSFMWWLLIKVIRRIVAYYKGEIKSVRGPLQ